MQISFLTHTALYVEWIIRDVRFSSFSLRTYMWSAIIKDLHSIPHSFCCLCGVGYKRSTFHFILSALYVEWDNKRSTFHFSFSLFPTTGGGITHESFITNTHLTYSTNQTRVLVDVSTMPDPEVNIKETSDMTLRPYCYVIMYM